MSDPTPAPDHAYHAHGPADTSEVPSEFGLSLIGDANGLAAVLMAFGHLRWQFTPELAADLGGGLIQAAQQARQHNAANAQAVHPANTPRLVHLGEVTSGIRPSGLVIP